MKPEWKQIWVDALQCGRYEQIRGALRRDNCFCAIGVLLQEYTLRVGEGTWVPVPNPSQQGTCEFCFSFAAFWSTWTLLEQLQTTFDMTADDIDQSTQWNDIDAMSFSQIADRIKAEL